MKFYSCIKIIILLLFISCETSAQNNSSKLYYAWELNPSRFVEDKANVIPVNINGSNYRIIGIENFKGTKVTAISNDNKNLDIEVSDLAYLKNYNGYTIIDPIIPIKLNQPLLNINNASNSVRYFLLKIKGLKSGSQPLHFSIKTNITSYTFNKTVLVSSFSYKKSLNINAWAYFDYNFMLKGARASMLNNLIQHDINILVIPPYALPNISDNKATSQSLNNYLEGTKNKFDYYLIYFGGFQDKADNFLSDGWVKNYSNWLKTINQTLNNQGILTNQILLYPYDEAKGNNINKLQQIINLTNTYGFKNKFFATTENQLSLQKSQSVQFKQVHTNSSNTSNLANDLKSNTFSNSVWIYETKFGRSREQSPLNYLVLGWKASQYKATGIGLWNYCDVQNAYEVAQQNKIRNGTASWTIQPTNPGYDYSLIYRKGNQLYSSIREKALQYGNEDYFWLDIYEKKYGLAKKNELIKNLISNKTTTQDWENIKIELIN